MAYSDKSAQVKKLIEACSLQPPLTTQQLREQRNRDNLHLTWSSVSLAGNRLTAEETGRILADRVISGKPLSLHLLILGHSEACNMLYYLARLKHIEPNHLCALHQLCTYRCDAEQAGKYRTAPVILSETSFMPPSPAEIPAAITTFMAQCEQQRAQNSPLHYAAWLHNQCMAIHPFVSANDIVARLLLNLGLLQCGYPVATILPEQREAYLSAIRSAQNKDSQPFVNLLSHQVLNALKNRPNRS